MTTTRFIDGEGMLVTLEARNKKHLSLTGKRNGNSGQITFTPLGDEQKEIQEIRNNRHLKEADSDVYSRLVELFGIVNIEEVEDVDDYDELDFDDEVIALAKHLAIPKDEIGEIEHLYSGNIYSYRGMDYIVGDDDDCNKVFREAIEDLIEDYGLDFWSSGGVDIDVSDSGLATIKKEIHFGYRGDLLNRYDGSEDYEEVNGETYYIYKQ